MCKNELSYHKIKNTQEIKRTLFNKTKQDKTSKFSMLSCFSSYVQYNRKQLNQLCPLGARKLAEGKKPSERWQSTLFPFFVCFLVRPWVLFVVASKTLICHCADWAFKLARATITSWFNYKFIRPWKKWAELSHSMCLVKSILTSTMS